MIEFLTDRFLGIPHISWLLGIGFNVIYAVVDYKVFKPRRLRKEKAKRLAKIEAETPDPIVALLNVNGHDEENVTVETVEREVRKWCEDYAEVMKENGVQFMHKRFGIAKDDPMYFVKGDKEIFVYFRKEPDAMRITMHPSGCASNECKIRSHNDFKDRTSEQNAAAILSQIFTMLAS